MTTLISALFVVPLAVAMFVLPGCSRGPAQDPVAAAKEQISKREFKTAILSLKQSLQKEGPQPEARYLLGFALLEDGQPVAAAVELGKAVELGFEPDLAVPAFARAMVRTGQTRRLIESHGNTSLTLPRANADLQTSLARAHFDQRDPNRAAAAIEAALRADPNFPGARILQARALGASGRFDDAIAVLRSVITTDPGDTLAHQSLGEMLIYGPKDLNGASQAFGAALKVDPANVGAHAALVGIAMRQRNIPEAKARLTAMQQALPKHPQTVLFEAQIAAAENRLDVARDKAQQLLRSAPNDVRVMLLAGTVEYLQGALLLAESHLTKAMGLDPAQPAVRTLLAQTLLRAGDPDKSLSTLAPLLEAADPAAEVLGLAAEAQMQMGNQSEATKLFARAATANPENPRYRAALALTKIARGEADAGLGELASIAATDSTAFADLALVNARVAAGDLAGALTAVEGVETKKPKSPIGAMLRGTILQQQKNPAAARASYERALAIDKAYYPAVATLAELDLQDKQPEAAKKRFEALLKADPKNYRARLALAETYRRTGAKPEQIQTIIEEAVRLSPSDAPPRLALVNHLMGRREVKAALAAAQAGEAALPTNLEMLDALGRTQAAAGEQRQAQATFRKLAAALPRNPMPLLRLAETQMATGDRPAAMQMLRQALQLAPSLLPAQQSLFDLAMGARQWGEALDIARTVQKQRPTRAEGFLWEGAAFAAQKRWEPAIASFRAALQRNRSTETVIHLHAAYLRGGKRAEAVRLENEWLSANKGDVPFNMYLGDSANARQEYAIAESRYLAALEGDKTNALGLNNLAWVLTKQGKAGAARYAEQANKLAPENAAFLDTWALALASEGDVSRALETQRKAVALAPDLLVLRLHLARIAIRAGDKALASAELEKLAYLGEKFPAQAEVSKLMKDLH